MSKDAAYTKMIQSKQWKELRHKKLNEQPLCEDCLAVDLYVPAREVHHVTPVETAIGRQEMERLMFNYGNLRALCHDCHVLAHKTMRTHTKEAVKENTRRKTERFKDKFLCGGGYFFLFEKLLKSTSSK